MGHGCDGQGPVLDIIRPKTLLWAGMPEKRVGDNDIHQFVEYSLIEDADLHELVDNLDAAFLTKVLPSAYEVLEPLAKLDLRGISTNYTMNMSPFVRVLGSMFGDDEFKQMMGELEKAQRLIAELTSAQGAFAAEVEELGFPVAITPPFDIAYDFYSDFLRGTMLTSMDIYTHPDVLKPFMDRYVDSVLGQLKENPPRPGSIMFTPMHKGMDGFMSSEQYAEFYWSYFQRFIDAWIGMDCIPYIYTEGPYNSRISYIKEQIPKGKCLIHFEEGDPAAIKAELGDTVAITGFYPEQLLVHGTRQEVVDRAKELIDALAPGGGYLFDFDGGLYDKAKPENFEALMETIKDYGTY